MDFDNIYDYCDYDEVCFSDILESAIASNFFTTKYVRSDDSISMASDVLDLFTAHFYIFRDYAESHGIYKSSSKLNALYNRTNKSTLAYCSNALRSLTMAVSTANIPLAMRIMRSLYETLVISTALNYKLSNQKTSVLNKSATKKAESICGVDENDDKFYINKIKEKLNKNDINSTPSRFSSFDCSFDWTAPLFESFDESKIKSVFNKSLEQLLDNIEIEDITKILGLYEFDSMHQMTDPFYHHSIIEIYSNSKNPTISPLCFDDPNESGLSYYSKYEEAFFLDEIKQLGPLFSTYFRSTALKSKKLINRFDRVNEDIVLSSFSYYSDDYYPDSESPKRVKRISFESGNESSYVNIVKNFKQQAKDGISYNIDKDDYYKDLEECNIDPMFIKILTGLTKSDSTEEMESINNYFSTYKDNYIVSDDAFFIDENNPRWFDKNKPRLYGYYDGLVNEGHSSDLAYKWQNIFKSLLNGLRFDDIKNLPIEAQYKFFETSDYKKIFINYNAENHYSKEESAIAQFLISTIQSFTNICNLILINDASTALNEAKKLYESIIIKTYIGIKNKKELSGIVENQDNLPVFKFLSEAMNYTTITIQLTNDKKELIESNLFPQNEYVEEKAEKFFSKKHPKLIKDMIDETKLFSFAADDDLHSIDDIALYLSNTIGLDVSASTFNRMYLSNLSINVPFFNDGDASDNTLSLMILDFASLLNRTLSYDIISDLIADEYLNKVVDVINFMIEKDLDEIDV